MTENKNVVLFPGLQSTLEEESMVALSEQNFVQALSKLNQLIDYGVNHHEVMTGKLICLMELDQLEEAQELTERLFKTHPQHYYEYLHMYLTILFQTAQYDLLIESVDDEMTKEYMPPDAFRDQFIELQNLSRQMRDEIVMERSAKLMKELHQAHQNAIHQRQWSILEELSHINAMPRHSIAHYLIDDDVHPMVKTSLFKWYREQGVDQIFDIHKIGLSGQFNPAESFAVTDHPIYKQMMLLINGMEQDNPTLFQLLQDLVTRFFYVRYPILPSMKELDSIAEALKQIGLAMLNIDNEQLKETSQSIVQHYIDEINLCDGLYLSIMSP